MHPDDLIDDIARRMTSGNGLRGSVRQRVRAEIDASPQQSVWSGRLAHVGLGVACAGVIAVLLVLPASRSEPDPAPAVAARADVPAERFPGSEDPGLPQEGSAGTSVPAGDYAVASATQAASVAPPAITSIATVRAATMAAPTSSSVRAGGGPGVGTAPARPGVGAAAVGTASVGLRVGADLVAALDTRPPATTLQPLAGPDPIVIEPVPMQRLAIAPLTVEAIELTAIAIPPLAPLTPGGV